METITSRNGQLLRLRQMTAEDTTIVAGIEACATAFPWSLKNFQDCIKAQHQAWVLLDSSEQIIGFVITQKVVDECHLLNICVNPSHQGQGLGASLLNHVIAYAADLKLSLIVLEVRRSNQRAQQLYLQKGFNEMAVRPNYYPAHQGREDAILMGYDLAMTTFFDTAE